eukprot:m.221610 g.221610  ORF g.221610 m.221610 type:complete len:155 (+) comp10617_c0_seq1:644-1108(+)
MGKSKKEKTEEEVPKGEEAGEDEGNYDELVKRISAISNPLASKKLTKKIYKTVKRAHKAKLLCRGVKEVGKALRKGSKGVCIIAGDISPIDVISHMPVLCEEAGVPYCYVPSKEDLGAAGQTKRPTSVVLLKPADSLEGYKELHDELKALKTPY